MKIYSSIGSDRSLESIRTKIIRVMASYKETYEKLNNTGNGLTGLEHTTFKEYIIRDVCKYYYKLDPVLKNRPNVYPHYTNEDEERNILTSIQKPKNTQSRTIFLTSSSSSDDKSLEDYNTNMVQYNRMNNSAMIDMYCDSNMTSFCNTKQNSNDDGFNTSPVTTSDSNNKSGDTDTSNATRVGTTHMPRTMTPQEAKKRTRMPNPRRRNQLQNNQSQVL